MRYELRPGRNSTISAENLPAVDGWNLHPPLERNERACDLVVGGVHGHFAPCRQALAELQVDEHDRLFSLGNLVDGGPRSFEGLHWIAGPDPSTRLFAETTSR